MGWGGEMSDGKGGVRMHGGKRYGGVKVWKITRYK